MTREQNQLLKKIKNLSPDEVARVIQFLQQLKSPELRVVPPDLRSVPAPAGAQEEQTAQFDAAPAPALQEDAAPPTGPSITASPRAPAQRQETLAPEVRSPEAEIAREACAQWRRRPFQAIDADDLQPIAALFREAVDNRAANRFRLGTR